jgi:cytidylate kinase
MRACCAGGRHAVEFTVRDDGGERISLDGKDVTGAVRAETTGQGASRVAAGRPFATR